MRFRHVALWIICVAWIRVTNAWLLGVFYTTVALHTLLDYVAEGLTFGRISTRRKAVITQESHAGEEGEGGGDDRF